MGKTIQLNAKGLACPMPIVMMKKSMDALQSGDTLEVTVTDHGAVNDFPAWAKSCGHTLLQQTAQDDTWIFLIQKA